LAAASCFACRELAGRRSRSDSLAEIHARNEALRLVLPSQKQSADIVDKRAARACHQPTADQSEQNAGIQVSEHFEGDPASEDEMSPGGLLAMPGALQLLWAFQNSKTPAMFLGTRPGSLYALNAHARGLLGAGDTSAQHLQL